MSPSVYAEDTVVISGTATVSSGTPTSLSICFMPWDGTSTSTCFPADSSGNYSATIPSTHNSNPLAYSIYLEGVLGDLEFTSDSIFVSNPQNGILNFTQYIHTESVTVKDQFGNLVDNSQIQINQYHHDCGDNLQYSSSGITVDYSCYAGYPYSMGTTYTNAQGIATIPVIDDTSYNVSVMPPVGTNYYTQAATGDGFITAQQTQPNIAWLLYPNWIAGNLTSRFTNSTPSLYWLPYTGADHYDIYRYESSQSDIPGRVGWYLGNTSGTSYNDQSAVQEGAYHYSLVALDSNNNVLAVVESQNFTIVQVDKTAPVVSGLTMSKTTINSKTGPITITVASATDTVAMDTGEYFVDSDPGVGNGVPMTFNGTGLVATTSSLASLSKGTHVMHARAVDKAGNWSTVLNLNFVVR